MSKTWSQELLNVLFDSIFQQIKEQLDADSVTVKDAYGDGRHVRLNFFTLKPQPFIMLCCCIIV